MHRVFKYRLWTREHHGQQLGELLEGHRRLYNECLDFKDLTWSCYRKTLTWFDCNLWFKHARKANPFYAKLNFTSAQATMGRVHQAFVAFFRRAKKKVTAPGYPRFKSMYRFNTIEFPQPGNGIGLNGDRLRVSGVGTIRVKLHRPVEGVINTFALHRYAGLWYVLVRCELPDLNVPQSTLPAVGLKLGVEPFAATSDGQIFDHPQFLARSLSTIRERSRSLQRKQKRGANWHKAVLALEKAHARIRNQRRDFHYRLARALTSRYGTIAIERMPLERLLRDKALAPKLSDAGLATFVEILKHVAAKVGARVVEVDHHDVAMSAPTQAAALRVLERAA